MRKAGQGRSRAREWAYRGPPVARGRGLKGALLSTCLFLAVFARSVGPSAARPDTADALAGRYGSHFKNGDVQGDTYWSDDVVEIVRVSGNAAYVRLELDFYNGHMCSVGGIGRVEGGRIVYDDHAVESPSEPPCVLSVSRRGGDLLIDDGGGSCKTYCGERGSLSDQTLPFSSRRPISYMKRLKASLEYADALKAWDAHQAR